MAVKEKVMAVKEKEMSVKEKEMLEIIYKHIIFITIYEEPRHVMAHYKQL